MPISGITITESAISTATTATQGFDQAVMVITSAAATGLNVLTSVKDAADFVSKFPGTVDAVLQSVKLFFINYPEGRLLIISGSDATNVTTGDTKLKADLLFGIAALVKLSVTSLAIVLCPQRSQLAVQADRTAVYSAIESMVSSKRWLFFVNTASDVDTKTKATTERALYSSQTGNSALFYGIATDADSKQVPVAAAAAAIALYRSKVESPFDPPGGSKYPIKGLTSITGNIDQQADYDDLKAANVNVIQNIPGVGLCFWGARTLSTEPKFLMINSRMAMSILASQLERSLLPTLFDSIDPAGTTRREITRICTSIMQQAFLNGALSGATPEESYRIDEVEVAAGGDLKKVQIKIYARFVGTLEMIEVQLINVDLVPTA